MQALLEIEDGNQALEFETAPCFKHPTGRPEALQVMGLQADLWGHGLFA